jgi:DNA-binding transcriptional regulator YhcF (GntR family)
VRIRIDPASRTPVSVQLREALAARIVSGRLAPQERLPPVRELAAQLGLAPNTVAKAYRELESAGALVGRGRLGTFVADAPEASSDPEASLAAAARDFAGVARRLGVPPGRALEVVRGALRTGGSDRARS